MSNVMPPTMMRVTGGEQIELELAVFDKPDDRFAVQVRSFPVSHGRLCLDCGHVAPSVPDAALAQIRASLSTLRSRS